ncbi:MAG: restriction endonuclease subunit S [Flavobacteriales bacterium]|nr:restriction endonuclease subunit S [Flavobacteriales bacterium]
MEQTAIPTKPSGIPWLGDIPAHWEVKRLRYGVNLSTDRVEVDEEVVMPYVGMENIESWTGKLLPLDEEFVPTGTSNRFKKSQVLFGKLRPYLAKATVAEHTGVCSTELMVFEPVLFESRFLLYTLLSDGFIKLVDSSTQGSKMPRADWEFVGNMRVTLPPLPEQRAIAAFLDERTARIDGLIARKQRLVALLREKRQALITRAVTRGLDANVKLKESGVPWLGLVPEHWGVKRVKQVTHRITKGTTPTTEGGGFADEGEVTFIKVESIDDRLKVMKHMCARIDHETHMSLSRSHLQEGDVLLSIAGAIGRVAIVRKEILPANANQAVGIIRPDPSAILSEWLALALHGHGAQEQFALDNVQSAQANLSLTNLGNTWITLPTISEQTKTLAQVRTITGRIDALIAKVEAAVLRLVEYRVALISAAVTGKVRV